MLTRNRGLCICRCKEENTGNGQKTLNPNKHLFECRIQQKQKKRTEGRTI